MVVIIMICENLLLTIQNKFNKPVKTKDELKSKLQELFEDNKADYDKFANWYDKKEPLINICGKDEYEHYVIENYKKSVYGDSYEIKEYVP